MTRAESEKAIRHLCHVWAKERGIPQPPTDQPSFQDFKSWLDEKGYSHYLTFRSETNSSDDAERWFDEEFFQTWRN